MNIAQRYAASVKRDCREAGLRLLAEKVRGMHCGVKRAERVLDIGDWSDYWPTLDQEGHYDGGLVDAQDGYVSVGNDAMVSVDLLPTSVVAALYVDAMGLEGCVSLSRNGKFSY